MLQKEVYSATESSPCSVMPTEPLLLIIQEDEARLCWKSGS